MLRPYKSGVIHCMMGVGSAVVLLMGAGGAVVLLRRGLVKLPKLTSH